MAINFDTILSAANVVGYYKTSVRDIQRHPFLALFPAHKNMGMEMTFVKGANNAPVVLKPSAFDANAPIRSRGEASTIALKIPLMREELPIKEVDRQKLLQYQALGNQYLNQALADIYADRANTIDGATAQRIRMIGAALSTGAISITGENVTMTADYGFNASTQKTTLTNNDLWSATSTATPIADLLAAKAAAKLTRCAAYMNQATFTEMIACDEVKDTIYPSGYSGVILDSVVKQWLQGQGIFVVIVDGVIETNHYAVTLGGTEYDFYPDGYVTIAPLAALGQMEFGTTPEEADLLAGIGDVRSIEIVDTGVAVVSLVNAGPPVKVSTVVSQMAIPSFTLVGKIHIIVV